MSTQYAIINKENSDENYESYLIIGNTYWFTQEGFIIQQYLSDDTKIISIGNNSDLKTIKDLREYYESCDSK